jgi:hypothetical protein
MMAAACGAVKHAASTPLSSITILAAPAIIVEAPRDDDMLEWILHRLPVTTRIATM